MSDSGKKWTVQRSGGDARIFKKAIANAIQEYAGSNRLARIEVVKEIVAESGGQFTEDQLDNVDFVGSFFYEKRISAKKATIAYRWLQKTAPEFVLEIDRKSPDQGGAVMNVRDQAGYVGTIPEATARIFARRHEIKSIWNTHIVTDDRVKYTQSEVDSFKELFITVARKRMGRVYDVVGGELGTETIKKHVEVAAEIARELIGREKQYYQFFNVQSGSPVFPFINFMIVVYDDDSEEVYFGWGGFHDESEGYVYMSSDRYCTRIFKQVHKGLTYDRFRVAGTEPNEG